MIHGYLDLSGHWRPHTRISDTTSVHMSERVKRGDNVHFGHDCLLEGAAGITPEEGIQLAAWVGAHAQSSHIAIRHYWRHYPDVPEDDLKGYERQMTTIGRHADVGAHATLLLSADIGEGAVLAAGSVVAWSVAAWSVAASAPAGVVGDTREGDESYLADPLPARWHAGWQQDGPGRGVSH